MLSQHLRGIVVMITLLLSLPDMASAVDKCAQDGSDYSYSEEIDGSKRTIVTNGCPNHPCYNLNPNYAVKSSTTYDLPATPKFVGSATDSSTASANVDLSEQGGAVGILFNGAQMFSPYGGPTYGQSTSWETGAVYAEGNTFDQCGCHSSSTSAPSYHCHQPPACLLRQLGQADTAHSPQIGWAFDGFPIYGPRGPGGVMMMTCTESGGTYGTDVCTDDCGGYYLSDGSIDEFVYRYYIQGEYNDGTSCALPGCASPSSQYYPPTPLCFRGCCPSGLTCSGGVGTCPGSEASGVTDGYSASVPTVNSLPLASGLPTNDAGCSCDDVGCQTCSDADQDWKKDTCSEEESNTCSTSTGGLVSNSPPMQLTVLPYLILWFARV